VHLGRQHNMSWVLEVLFHLWLHGETVKGQQSAALLYEYHVHRNPTEDYYVPKPMIVTGQHLGRK